MDRPTIKRIVTRIFLLQQAGAFTTMPFSTYLLALIGQVSKDQIWIALAPVPVLALIFAVGAPLIGLNTLVSRALMPDPNDPMEVRLQRLLKLPRAIELMILGIYCAGVIAFTSWLVILLKKPVIIIPWGTMVFASLAALVMIWTRIYIERLLMPLALEQFGGKPGIIIEGKGLLWPKQRWYLPYAFAMFVICTLLTTGTVVTRVLVDKYDEAIQLMDAAAVRVLHESFTGFTQSIWLPLLSLGLFMLFSAAFSAIMLARHQHSGFQAIQKSIEGFVDGNPMPPAWLTTDELGDLARITAQAFDKLREFSLSLKATASSLGTSAEALDRSNSAQNEAITRQAAALQETQVTAQEIRQTSVVASQKAESVLQQTHTIEKLARDGEMAIEQSISSLQEIRSQVTEMASRIKALGERAKQIEGITRTVKDLADQSNMLALNAAIEAVRSGEHGKGFGVVAREIRSLADQSIRATGRVREILQELGLAIRSTVEITEQGSERVRTSAEQVRAFGDNIRRLSSIMQENTLSVRQISAAVNQQNQGITQIFQAINDLNTIMDDTMVRLNNSASVTTDVRQVATRVSQLIASHGWERAKDQAIRKLD